MTATTRSTAPPKGIIAKGLRKAYGEKVVLDGVDLQVSEGTVFALLGPNGAGKTTTVQILSTLVSADAGDARVAGHSLEQEADAVRDAIGVTGQFAAVDGLLTAEENLFLMADLLHLEKAEGRRRAAELLARFDLTEVAKKPAAAFSGGMRRKLDLAMTLVGRPSIIFLDEPTTGLDPRSRRTMWDMIRDLVAGGTTIFLTTQYLEEADQLADRIAVLDGGGIVAEGTADELKRRIPGGHIKLRFDEMRHMNAASDRLALSTVTRDDESLTLQIPSDGSIPALRAVLDVLEGAGIHAEALTVHTPDLDDVFLALTGSGTRDRQP
ncbi:ATP-binding cassette domain-containing protein [Streptomyces flavofungini]|uniref:ATP-binding cassette domain-containing protein n=1 Tax=Streptomyces flavofungini TaxID=68200 RepID=A0ABS0X1B5_9ACTN|nr:ATP-binding cassette domain-containing protein [Streptomyces flavofungini]MBJ3806966.1 ATP-binding cassette domain-containing protein [Streptomyces flavofungini]GHC59371.1 daunorubicin resistance protein DrrA family ABC transporter ATP-binding protein [Streptomyces flavofungini]